MKIGRKGKVERDRIDQEMDRQTDGNGGLVSLCRAGRREGVGGRGGETKNAEIMESNE